MVITPNSPEHGCPSARRFFAVLGAVLTLVCANAAKAQLVSGLELGLNSIKLNDTNPAQPVFGRDRGILNGTRFFFGSQRNWTSLGWIADFDYQTGPTDHIGPTKSGYSIATAGNVRVVTVGATLNWPMTRFDGGSIALAPRLGYRNLVRKSDAAPSLVGNLEDTQLGIAALGFLLNGEFDRSFGVSAKFEVERSFAARQSTSFQAVGSSNPQSVLLSSPNAQWRPQIELSAWYRINPRHSLTIRARAQDFSTGASDSFDNASLNPNSLTSLPGQKIRMNSLRAGWAYHF
jgi:hypothetical protein